MYSALSTFNTTTEVLLSKAPNPHLLPGGRSINGCPLLRVCVPSLCVFTAVCALGWLNVEHEFQVWVTIIGCMSLSQINTVARTDLNILNTIDHTFLF